MAEQQLPLNQAYINALVDMPNMLTDEAAKIGANRTYKYLSLGTLCKTVKQVFAQHGLMFRQSVELVETDSNKTIAKVCTYIFNANDEILVSEYPFYYTADSQANGSAVTYARRYSLYAALGIYPDKDDDGKASTTYSTQFNDSRPQTITQDVAISLIDLAKEYNADLKTIARKYAGHDITRPTDIPTSAVELIRKEITNAHN